VATVLTLTAYENDWSQIERWGQTNDWRVPAAAELDEPLSVDLVVRYVEERLGSATPVKLRTVERQLVAVKYFHHQRGLYSPSDHPRVIKAMGKLQRRLPDQPRRRAKNITAGQMTAILTNTPADTPMGSRKRAMLLVGWTGEMERMELVGLDIERVDVGERRWSVDIRNGRNPRLLEFDRTGLFDTGLAINEWLSYRNPHPTDPLFCRVNRFGTVLDSKGVGPHTVNRLVKDSVRLLGLDPSLYSGNSLKWGHPVDEDE